MSTEPLITLVYIGPIVGFIFGRLLWFIFLSSEKAEFWPMVPNALSSSSAGKDYFNDSVLPMLLFWPATLCIVTGIGALYILYYALIVPPVILLSAIRRWRLNRSKKSNITH